MDSNCNLEVDINGEEVFMVDKKILCSYSAKINKLLCKSKNETRRLKVIFHDFPGGAANFELITRFCYNNGKTNISPFNISNIACAAYFMEMNNVVSGVENLCEQIEKSVEEIRFWTWSELMVALRQCQNLLHVANSIHILDKFLDSLVGRVASSFETSSCPSTSSPDSSGFRLSSETRSSESLKNTFSRTTWWFEDLVGLNIHVIEMVVRMMVARNLENGIIGKFLFYYIKSRLTSTPPDEKVKIVEAVVEMLYSLDVKCLSYKSLFEIIRIVISMKLSLCCKEKLENMIGSLLDQASLDNLLVPSPVKKSYLYDVNLVLRFLKSFLGNRGCCVPLTRLKKVVRMMDLYLAEIAPDPYLKPSKFLAVIRALPDSARDSFDGVYHAVNLYLEVHSGMSEEQKIKVCKVLNYEKLSSEAINDLTRNANFPSNFAAQALISQQHKLKNLLQDTATITDYDSGSFQTTYEGRKNSGCQQIVLYAKKFSVSGENEKLKTHLQGMQWRVSELEKVCRKMQLQMAKMMKSRLLNHSDVRSVPKICS